MPSFHTMHNHDSMIQEIRRMKGMKESQDATDLMLLSKELNISLKASSPQSWDEITMNTSHTSATSCSDAPGQRPNPMTTEKKESYWEDAACKLSRIAANEIKKLGTLAHVDGVLESLQEHKRSHAIAHVEDVLESQQKLLPRLKDDLVRAQTVLRMRLNSKSLVAIIVSINEYKKLEAQKAAVELIVEKLNELLSTIISGPESWTVLKQSKKAVKKILQETVVQAKIMNLLKSDVKAVHEEACRIKQQEAAEQ